MTNTANTLALRIHAWIDQKFKNYSTFVGHTFSNNILASLNLCRRLRIRIRGGKTTISLLFQGTCGVIAQGHLLSPKKSHLNPSNYFSALRSICHDFVLEMVNAHNRESIIGIHVFMTISWSKACVLRLERKSYCAHSTKWYRFTTHLFSVAINSI